MRRRMLRVVHWASRAVDRADVALSRLHWRLDSEENRQAAREYPDA